MLTYLLIQCYSGSWSGPCSAFVDNLLPWFQHIATAHPGKAALIFVSADQELSAYAATRVRFPLSLPFPVDHHQRLSETLGAHTLPTLLVLDGQTTEVLDNHGQDLVSTDPNAEGFPWKDQFSPAGRIKRTLHTVTGTVVSAGTILLWLIWSLFMWLLSWPQAGLRKLVSTLSSRASHMLAHIGSKISVLLKVFLSAVLWSPCTMAACLWRATCFIFREPPVARKQLPTEEV